MNFYSKHSSHIFQKINSTLETILSSKYSSLSQQINLYEKIVNELLKNSMINQIQTFQQAKFLALQLVLLIAQNNDSSLHSLSYWQNMMKSNQVVSYFASISNILRSIQQLLIGLQSEQSVNENKIKNKKRKSPNQERPLSLCYYRQQFSKMIQSLQSKFRQSATINPSQNQLNLNLQENQILIQQLQELIQKKDIKIQQMAQKVIVNTKQTEQLEILVLKLQEKNLQYSNKVQKIQKDFKALQILNIQSKMQKKQLQSLNKQLQNKNRQYIQKLQQIGIEKSQKLMYTKNTISCPTGKSINYEDKNQNYIQKSEPTSLKSFRRINNKETTQKQIQKSQSESNLLKMLFSQAITIQNLL